MGCRLMTAQKVAHPPVACRPSPSPCRRFCTNLGLSSVFLPLAPVGRPPRAGGKRRAEPSATSRRAHGRSKGRGPARRLPPLSQPLPALLHEPRAQFRLPPPPSCRQAVPRRREEARRAIDDVPASSRPLKRSLTRPSLAAPLPAVAGDEITNLGLSSVSPPSLL